MTSTVLEIGAFALLLAFAVVYGRVTRRATFAIQRQFNKYRILRPFLGAALMRIVFTFFAFPMLLCIVPFIWFWPSWEWRVAIPVIIMYGLSVTLPPAWYQRRRQRQKVAG